MIKEIKLRILKLTIAVLGVMLAIITCEQASIMADDYFKEQQKLAPISHRAKRMQRQWNEVETNTAVVITGVGVVASYFFAVPALIFGFLGACVGGCLFLALAFVKAVAAHWIIGTLCISGMLAGVMLLEKLDRQEVKAVACK